MINQCRRSTTVALAPVVIVRAKGCLDKAACMAFHSAEAQLPGGTQTPESEGAFIGLGIQCAVSSSIARASWCELESKQPKNRSILTEFLALVFVRN